MAHQLQCNVCGAKSISVDNPRAVTRRELDALREFKAEHDTLCWRDDVLNFPQGVVSTLTPPVPCGPFGSEKAQPLSVSKPHGHGEYMGPYGEVVHIDTVSCCHCRRHVEVRKGTLEDGGFCARCYNGDSNSGWTCGSERCQLHVPYEVQLDNADAGRPLLTPPAPQVPSGFGGAVILSANGVKND